MTFQCGCLVGAERVADYCDLHLRYRCHFHSPTAVGGECPNCFRNRMLSVDTSYATNRLGRLRETEDDRQRDKALGVRLAEPGEFPAHLTQHSKVRQ